MLFEQLLNSFNDKTFEQFSTTVVPLLGLRVKNSANMSRNTIQKSIERSLPDWVFYDNTIGGKFLSTIDKQQSSSSRAMKGNVIELTIPSTGQKIPLSSVRTHNYDPTDIIPENWISSVTRTPEVVFADLAFGVLKANKSTNSERDKEYLHYAERLRNKILKGDSSILLLEDLLMVYLSQLRNPAKSCGVDYTISTADIPAARSIGLEGTKYYPYTDGFVGKKMMSEKPLELTKEESLFLRITSEMLLFRFLQEKGEI